MMGLLRSSVGVGGENGQSDWSMRMVEDDDVSYRSSDLLSWLLCVIVLVCFGHFLGFYGFFIDG